MFVTSSRLFDQLIGISDLRLWPSSGLDAARQKSTLLRIGLGVTTQCWGYDGRVAQV
jgi:hypothetical protein